MRIIQITDTLRSGGKERQLIELLKGLTATQHVENELIVMSNDIHYTYLTDLNIPVHFLVRQHKKDPRIFIKLFNLLRERKPDILHSWNSMCSIYAIPSVKLLKIKFVNGFIRSAPPSVTFPNKRWFRSRITFPFSDAVVANSNAGLCAYQTPPNKSHCIYNGFDMQRVETLPAKTDLWKKYDIQTKYVVGMVASFSLSKDYGTFIKAAITVLEQRDDITFLMIGDGPTRASLENAVPIKYCARIRFLGLQTQVEEIVSIFSIGVLTSPSEGISNAIMEYMALAKPVIATNNRGNKELIIDNATGFLIPNEDSIALANRILKLLNDDELAVKIGQAGRQHLLMNFGLQQLAQNHLMLYNELCS